MQAATPHNGSPRAADSGWSRGAALLAATLALVFILPADGHARRAGGAGDADADADASATVGMTNRLTYEPEHVTIKVGQQVLWKNTSDLVHTVTADAGQTSTKKSYELPKGAKPFHSGLITPGGSFAHRFVVAGKYKYFCVPHEGAQMYGYVTVRE